MLHGQHMYWWGMQISSSNILYLKIAADWKWRLWWNWLLRSPFTICRWLTAKESACQCRRCLRWGWIPGSGRSPGAENGNPLQYTCPGNSMDREPGRLQSMRSQRVRHEGTCARVHTHTHTHALLYHHLIFMSASIFIWGLVLTIFLRRKVKIKK